ncbi:glycosyl hydrolase family 18 protein [Brevibacillus choshinensis]|uniref:glycosyl hydrolase family 18 protein n=1 Tax=Brevibacillus choshinensis TaxID=54911 RepID=UPI002E23882B|nr:glycosyl hydrolase family 18 protein [Brevibacillus choshinensis]MED4780641.1 glycosyl hydrolase family 18 protein [Brevibacillus choshinensis]
MKKQMRKHVVVLTVCLSVFSACLTGCGNDRSAPDSMKTVAAAEQPLEKTAWVVDWQWKAGSEDLQGMTNGLTSVQMFAAYFDESDNLFFTDAFKKGLPKVQEISRKSSLVHVDLTIVNDQLRKDGSDIQKDPTIVTRLMATKESRTKHVDQIMEAVSTYQFHGVEIDYERIHEKDWNNVLAFIEELYQRLQEQDKTLRIVLEPRTPFESLSLPKGPVYVMMAYNLFGTQTVPGPKADRSFITELANRMKKVPGEKVIAVSAGGFDWSESGDVTAVTEERAAELAKSSLEMPRRDNASGSIHFQYVDEKNEKHTVWYADGTTLQTWANVISVEGIHNIALWRLGDLGRESVRFMNK